MDTGTSGRDSEPEMLPKSVERLLCALGSNHTEITQCLVAQACAMSHVCGVQNPIASNGVKIEAPSLLQPRSSLLQAKADIWNASLESLELEVHHCTI